VVGDRERGTIAKDAVNKLREKMTSKALKFIDDMDQAFVRRTIADIQQKAKLERDLENQQKELKATIRQSRTHEGEYQLR